MFDYFEGIIIRLLFEEVCRPDRKVCRFGQTPGSNDPHVQGGWLTNETVVQLKLQGSKAVNIWKKKHADKKLYVKVLSDIFFSVFHMYLDFIILRISSVHLTMYFHFKESVTSHYYAKYNNKL